MFVRWVRRRNDLRHATRARILVGYTLALVCYRAICDDLKKCNVGVNNTLTRRGERFLFIEPPSRRSQPFELVISTFRDGVSTKPHTSRRGMPDRFREVKANSGSRMFVGCSVSNSSTD